MSTTDNKTDAEAFGDLLRAHKPGSGPDRYARFASNVLHVTRTQVLNELSKALDTHRQVVAVGGNGVGKSYAASALGLSALFCNADTIVPITAGNGDTVRNSIWKPIKSLHRRSGLPGRPLDNSRELRTEFEESWYLQCLSPRHPEDLEGDHNETVIYVIEEAEKPGVSAEHIDSARSTLTSDNDRLLVLANPPTDEGNVVSRLIDDDEWHTLKFPSWESHNIRIERGLQDGEQIKGLSTVDKLERDWREYHEDPWPGLERAIEVSSPYLTEDGELTVYDTGIENPEFRSDLHERWYKRRAGIIPPEGSDSWRPFTVSDVKAAYNRSVEPGEIDTFAVDVARSSDMTIGSGKAPKFISVEYAKQGTNHVTQKDDLKDILFDLNSPDIAVDAVGEGSGLADELDDVFSSVTRFSNGMKPRQESEYYDAWTEALDLFGDFLDSGGSFTDQHLYEEALAAAQTIEFDTKTLQSRGGDVMTASSKDAVKERLGHSPDYLDSALMANWLDMAQTQTVKRRKASATMHKGR